MNILKPEIQEFYIPVPYCNYIFNADAEGLTEAEEAEIKNWLLKNKLTGVPVSVCEQTAEFRHRNDVNNIPGECYLVDFLPPVEFNPIGAAHISNTGGIIIDLSDDAETVKYKFVSDTEHPEIYEADIIEIDEAREDEPEPLGFRHGETYYLLSQFERYTNF